MQLNISILPKIIILIPVWKRPEITEICFSGLDRLRIHRGCIDVMAVISENEYKSRCRKHEICYTFFENQPLGRKKNHGLREALKKDWDYLIEINSDDIIKNEWIDMLDTFIYDYVGLRNFCFINSRTLECRQFESRTLYGIGRRYSRKLIEMAAPDGNLWKDNATAGMDNQSNNRMMDAGCKGKQILTEQPLAADIKSEVNIWKWNPEIGVKYPIEEFYKGLSNKEIELINGLSN